MPSHMVGQPSHVTPEGLRVGVQRKDWARVLVLATTGNSALRRTIRHYVAENGLDVVYPERADVETPSGTVPCPDPWGHLTWVELSGTIEAICGLYDQRWATDIRLPVSATVGIVASGSGAEKRVARTVPRDISDAGRLAYCEAERASRAK